MDIAYSTKKYLLIALALSLAVYASLNMKVLGLVLVLFFLSYLVMTKKFTSFLFLSPFIALSFIPSGFVSVFRIPTLFGELRPSIILVIVAIGLFPFLSYLKLDVSFLRETKSLLIVTGTVFLVNIVSIIANKLTINQFQFTFFTMMYSFGILLLVGIYSSKINAKKIIKSSLYISSLVCILGVVEFLGFQPLESYYLIDNDIFNYARSTSSGLHRVVSSLGNPLLLSTYLLICFPFVLYMKDTESKKLLWNFITVLHLLAILLTQSRSAFVVLAVVILLFSAKSVKSFFKNATLVSFILGMFYLLLKIFGLTQVFEDRLLFRSESESISFRGDAFSYAFEMLKESPLIGLGSNTANQHLLNNSFATIVTLDNVFLMVLVETGLVGLMFFILSILILWKKFKKMHKSLRRIGHSLIAIIVGMGFSFNVVYFESVWGVFWLLSALLLLYSRQLKNNEICSNQLGEYQHEEIF